MHDSEPEAPAAPSRPSKEETEDWALGLLLDYLQEAGVDVAVLQRPDANTSSERAPDFELRVDGRVVAVEVTRLDRSGHDRVVGDAFSKALEAAVGDEIARRGRGLVVVHLYVHDTPARRAAEHLAREVAPDILSAIEDMVTGDSRELRRGNPSIELWLRDGPSRLFVTRGARSMGGATAAMAAEVVAKLVLDKATQALDYETVWILAIDMMVIVDADELAAALLSHPDLPTNWERLYLLPATDRHNVTEIGIR